MAVAAEAGVDAWCGSRAAGGGIAGSTRTLLEPLISATPEKPPPRPGRVRQGVYPKSSRIETVRSQP